MITLSLNGAVTEFVNGTSMVCDPQNTDEQAFADHWNRRTERNYGRGYRTTLTAPAWVFNWVMDTAEILLDSGAEATTKERKGVRDLLSAMTAAGIRKADVDGPTRLELIEAGYLTA